MFKRLSTTKIMNDLGMPIPNFAAIFGTTIPGLTLDSDEANVISYLDYWTAIMEWPVF